MKVVLYLVGICVLGAGALVIGFFLVGVGLSVIFNVRLLMLLRRQKYKRGEHP